MCVVEAFIFTLFHFFVFRAVRVHMSACCCQVVAAYVRGNIDEHDRRVRGCDITKCFRKKLQITYLIQYFYFFQPTEDQGCKLKMKKKKKNHWSK